MPTCNRWIRGEADRDFERLSVHASEYQQLILEDARQTLDGFLRFDPETQGTAFPANPRLRTLTCGPLRALFRVLPPEDRTVEVLGYMRNSGWSY